MINKKSLLFIWILLVSPILYIIGLNILYNDKFPVRNFESRMLKRDEIKLKQMSNEDLIIYNDYPKYKINILGETFKIGVYNFKVRGLFSTMRVFSILYLFFSNFVTFILFIIYQSNLKAEGKVEGSRTVRERDTANFEK